LTFLFISTIIYTEVIFLLNKTTLSPAEKLSIYAEISKNSSRGDTPPEVIIAEEYGGNEDEYLRVTALWLGIKI